jgi:hypothetical protein
MGKVAVEIDVKELEQAAERLPTPVKIRLAQRWGRSADASEWDRLFAAIDRRRRGRRFTMAEIVREVKAYRREQARG